MAALLASAVLNAATITGVVRAQGKPEVEHDVASGKYDSRRFKFVNRIDYGKLRDLVVYIDQPMTNNAPPAVPSVQIVRQKDAVFTPHVLPVMVGTTVRWPNQDDIFHNVFSYSAPKNFDLDLYKGNSCPDGRLKEVTFDKLGRVDVFCSIHSQMHCIMLVLPCPHFARADSAGKYSLPNVPPGTYMLKAWHERLPESAKQVQVPESGERKIDFTLGITGLPKHSVT
ncbi:MAG: hypothetical protein FJ403_15015 [Verrucomicrobia bacterium]|nr:hypothetical protein [Verrucomicrobiota bacterium]